MSETPRLTIRWASAGVIAVLLVGTGAVATYLLTRPSQQPVPAPTEASPPATSHSAGHAMPPASAVSGDGLPPDAPVTLTKGAMERAGIKVAAVGAGNGATAIRMPGVVAPNAYKQVVVTPLVSGRITRVFAELGQHVRRGQAMAQIFSPEIAEAQTRFISARAELEAHEKELRRTEKLAEIGAASRQDLERIHAGHTARTAEVQSARARVELLGVTRSAIDSLNPAKAMDATTNVPAPMAGIVTERLANVGLNIGPATKLFTVVDLSTVWIVADVYEKDFSRVRVGSPATVTTAAYPELALQGRISYVDPQVSPETRTAKARVEVPNPRGELRLGMLAAVSVAEPGQASVPTIPRTAAQNVGDRVVVYVADLKQPGRFVEREVRLGDAAGDRVPVLAGLNPGDMIVTEGSFYVRAERDRLGLPSPGSATSNSTAAPVSSPDAPRVTVTEKGFEPARFLVRAGAPVRITFLRTTDATCAEEVAIPTLNLKRTLPLNQPVTVEFTPQTAGDIEFVCGMGMLRGTIVVQ